MNQRSLKNLSRIEWWWATELASILERYNLAKFKGFKSMQFQTRSLKKQLIFKQSKADLNSLRRNLKSVRKWSKQVKLALSEKLTAS